MMHGRPKFVSGEPSPYISAEHLTGDWKGARSFLDRHGFTLMPYYYIDVVGNPVGGKAHGIAQASWLGVDLNFDFEKMAGWNGLSFFNSWAFLFGNNLSTEKIQNDFWVQELFYIETIILDSLFIKGSYPDIGLTFKIGRIHQADDFATSALYRYYVNIAFDSNPVSLLYNTVFTVTPVAVWGVYFEYQPFDFLIGKLGIYDGNINETIADFDHGMHFDFKSQEGIMLITEWDYLLRGSWPGAYKLGAMYQTGKDDPFTGELFGPGTRATQNEVQGDYNLYFTMEQTIYRGDQDQALQIFGTLLYGPKSKNLFPFFYSAGLIYSGFPLRNTDVLAFGFARGQYSADLRKIEEMDDMPPQHAEMAFELNYRFQFTPYFYLTPTLQYIVDPKGISSVPNALVIGFESGITF